jgi:hypothetical protein
METMPVPTLVWKVCCFHEISCNTDLLLGRYCVWTETKLGSCWVDLTEPVLRDLPTG